MKILARVALLSVISLASACGSSSPGGGGASGTTGSSGTTGAGGNGGSSGQAGGGGHASPCTLGATTTTLPACAAPGATSINVPSGCAPTVDGTYQSGEWGDAACITVGQDPVYVKYAGSVVYLAWPMKPTCGCPAHLAFNANGATSLDGHQFDLGIFDDPFTATGDANEFMSTTGSWNTTARPVAAGITIANPPMTPNYELAIPFSQLGITAGQNQSVGFAVTHSMAVWPAGLTATSNLPSDPSKWGKLTSSASWQ
jgi:hypothetical protein